jgi:dihydropteroate synthase
MSFPLKNKERDLPFRRPTFNLSAGHFNIFLGTRTKIMGILNITPDSFSSDGLLSKLGKDPHAHMRYGLKLIREGADILDVGGESTRPGSKPISAKEEIQRVIPLIRLLAKKTTIPISIDTYKPEVAKLALESGAVIVNTIMGTSPARALLKMISSYRAAIVLMHSRKTPQTMQKRILYQNLIAEIISELDKSLQKCLETGIKSDRIIIDPGIGFAKTAEHNLEIIKHLKKFSILKKPLLIGTSRKSFIGKIINQEPRKRLWGPAATLSACILNGAHIVRVHDVKQMRDVVNVTDAILNVNEQN